MNHMAAFVGKLELVALVFTVLALSGCGGSPPDEHAVDQVIGVKIYDHEGDLGALFDTWRTLGINTVFASVSLHSKDEFRALAEENGLATFLILPTFFNPEALEADSSLYAITDRGEKAIDEWVEFVCPSREAYRNAHLEKIMAYVRDLNPDGLSIDFIRHFVFWEKVYPKREPASIATTCFDAYCLRKFQADTQISLPASATTTAEAAASWIKLHHHQAWVQWKSTLITSMIEEIAREARQLNPDILINVHAVPWRENDFGGALKAVAGQDLSKIAPHADMISPMTYAHMVKRGPAWVHSVVEDMHRQAGGSILPSIQVSKAYLEDSLTVAVFRETLLAAIRPPSQGVVFWSWEALAQDPEKQAVVRTLLGVEG